MIELVIVFLLVFIVYQEYQNRKERKGLIEAFMAKNLTDLKVAEKIAESPPLKPPEPEVPPELMEVDRVSDEVFTAAIKKELGRESLLDKAKEKLKKGLT